MKRDCLTVGMIAGFPLIQLLLLGLAIYSDPTNPPAVVMADPGPIRPLRCRGDGGQWLFLDRGQR